MSWLIHTFRTLWRRSRPAGVAVVTLPVVMLVGTGVLLASAAGGEPAPPPDPASAEYTAEVLAAVGTNPDAFVADFVATALPGLSAGEGARLVEELAIVFGVDGDGDAAAAIADGVVRRLGLAAGEVDDLDELLALAMAEIDPDGSISDPDELIAAIEQWVAAVSPHVLKIVSGAAGLDALSFAGALHVLEGLEASSAVVEIGLDGIEGLPSISVPSVAWVIDEATGSITFSGETDALGGRTGFVLSAGWGGDAVPTVVAGVASSDRDLGDFGFRGDLGDIAVPDLTFVLAERGQVLRPSDVGPGAWSVLTADHGSSPEELVVDGGVNVLSAISGSSLPADLLSVVGASSGGGQLGVTGSLGPSFGVVSGASTPANPSLAVAIPGIDPPALPDWLSPSDAVPWALTFTGGGGEVEVGLRGGLDAQLDGGTRAFAAQFALSSDGSSAGGVLEGELREPWAAPFGVEWLTFEDLSMTVDLDTSAARAEFSADVVVVDRRASLTFEVGTDGSDPEVQMLATLDRLGTDDLVDFLAATTEVNVPVDIPDMAIEDVVIDIRAGAGATVAIGGRATVAGQQADVLASVESPRGEAAVMLGVAVDAFRLDRAIPALAGTLPGELEFPASAFVLSGIDGRVAQRELSRPAQRFFAQVARETLQLSPGLSILSSLDVSDSPVAEPMAAMGFRDGKFPVVGTLPSSLLGGGGGGSVLDDLSLALQLPEIRPAGAPEWFQGGRLSLVVDGTPSIGLEGEITVLIDGESLTFIAGAEFRRTPIGAELALFGVLETERPWESPFGVDWLTINRLAIELSIDAVANVGLGFAGDIVIGEKDIQAAIAVEVNAATGVPTNMLLSAASAEGFSTTDLLMTQQRMAEAAGRPVAIDASAYPSLDLRDIELRFAPQSSDTLGVEAGFVVAGDAWTSVAGGSPSRFAFMDFRLTEEGLFAAGELASYELGPLEWTDIVLDLELSRSSQHFMFGGAVTFLGLTAQAEIDISTDSILFAGRQALDELGRIVDGFEQAMEDPAEAIRSVPAILDDAGVATPEWLVDLLDRMADLTDDGQAVGEGVIQTILDGGVIPLVEFPAGGADPVCPVLQPIKDGGRCYSVPAIVSGGTPDGGVGAKCHAPYPFEDGGRCYTIEPTTVRQCPSGSVIKVSKPSECRKTSYPYSTVQKVTKTIAGVPAGGQAKSCGGTTPFSSGGRCWTVPPGEVIPAVPAGGVDLVCPLVWPDMEDGRCWTVTPSAAAAGIDVPGICNLYPEVSCSLDEVLSGRLLRTLFDHLVDRLPNW